MKKIIAWSLTAIAGPLLVAALQPHLPAAVSLSWPWVIAVSEWSGLPWVLAGIIGFQVGLWFDRWVSAFDGRNPITKSGKLRLLAARAALVADRCESALHSSGPYSIDPHAVRAEVYILGRKLSALGLSEPHLPPNDVQVMFSNAMRYFRSVAPAMAEGDVEAAARIASWVRQGQMDMIAPKGKPAG